VSHIQKFGDATCPTGDVVASPNCGIFDTAEMFMFCV
jgi:hypothetical protein